MVLSLQAHKGPSAQKEEARMDAQIEAYCQHYLDQKKFLARDKEI
jgi:hypothetical protein